MAVRLLRRWVIVWLSDDITEAKINNFLGKRGQFFYPLFYYILEELIILINQKFGKWTIIGEAPSRNRKKYWLCKCECGTERAVCGSDLKAGKSLSCGGKNCRTSEKLINEIGNTYGRLTVLKRAPNDMSGKAYWICQCECGKIITVNGVDLRSGHTQSCGCYQRDRTSEACKIDLIGQTIGNFTILEYAQKKYEDSVSSKWRCKCNLCGNENVFIKTAELKRQYSCGCVFESKGARKIEELLKANNIFYIKEKIFSDLIFADTKRHGRFDFFVNNKYIIEYDGVQHFIAGNGHFDNEEKFKKTQLHDQIKNEYCKKNNISLIRIPYTHFDNINIDDLIPETSKYLVNN